VPNQGDRLEASGTEIVKRLSGLALFFVITAVVIGCFMIPTVFWKPYKAATAKPSVAYRIDKLFAQWNRSDSPGCSLGVSKNGVPVYERAYGMANLELGVPITPASVFPAASISKQFTAMSILLLAKRGQLSLDDAVQKYIPEWADHGSRITIRHLLTHTSGLRDAFMLQGLAPPREDGGDRNEAIVKVLARTRGLNFAPGTEFQYNNGAYNLLGSMVKRVSGESLRAFADANIFKPLGMTHTHFHDDPSMVVPNRVSGYHQDGSGWHVALENGGIVGNAGLQTTVGDLLLWEQNFADVRVGDRALITAMQTPAIPTGWSPGAILVIRKYPPASEAVRCAVPTSCTLTFESACPPCASTTVPLISLPDCAASVGKNNRLAKMVNPIFSAENGYRAADHVRQ
jgi:CubicO group peptidase (beta-lactamase class C family)